MYGGMLFWYVVTTTTINEEYGSTQRTEHTVGCSASIVVSGGAPPVRRV
jgi:hypothetical protein